MIRTHYRSGFIKQYVRDHLLLRTEPATNDVTDYGVKRAVENLPQLRTKMNAVLDNYLNVQQDILAKISAGLKVHRSSSTIRQFLLSNRLAKCNLTLFSGKYLSNCKSWCKIRKSSSGRIGSAANR